MNKKAKLDEVMESLHILPVGAGYIDLITNTSNIAEFIAELNKLNIRIVGFTWWCYVDRCHSEPPHGMGGAKNSYGEGWYSEIELENVIELGFEENCTKNNNLYSKYILEDYPKDKSYHSCYMPGFWLDVPDNWKNTWKDSNKL